MFQSFLLAGLLWAIANVVPSPPASQPTAVTHTASFLPVPAPRVTAAESAQTSEEALVVMINAERSQRGLNTLTLDPMLVATARAHSEEMCSQNYFDHQSPTPGMSSPMDRYLSSLKQLGQAQPEYLLVGENIFYCSIFNDVYNADYAHRALMASPGHRANILEPRFAKVGIGIYRNAKGEFWVTEMFSRDRTP